MPRTQPQPDGPHDAISICRMQSGGRSQTWDCIRQFTLRLALICFHYCPP